MIPNAIKRTFFEQALALGEVLVRLDANHPDAVLPDELDRMQPVALAFGLAQPKPIPDLQILEDGIAATLSFNNTLQPTFVPWPAVLSISGYGCAAIFSAPSVQTEVPEPTGPKPGGLWLVRG